MKIKHSVITDGLSGTSGTSVMMMSGNSKFSYRREWVQPRRTIQNTNIGNASRGISEWITSMDPEAISEMKDYASKYRHLPNYGHRMKNRADNWFSIWTKALYEMAEKAEKMEDLREGKIGNVLSSAGVLTLKDVIENNYLPRVDGYESYTTAIDINS